MLKMSVLKEFQPNNKELSLETKLRLKQHEQEMELLMALFDIDSLEDEKVEEEVMNIEVSKEEIEIELMMMDQYRDFTLDINNVVESEWINNNIDLSHLLGTEENTIRAVARVLNVQETNAKLFIREALGYKVDSDYRTKQELYIHELIRDFDNNLYEEIEDKLVKSNLREFYVTLLEYVRYNISITPLGQSENDLVFKVDYDEFTRRLRKHAIVIDKRGIRRKLQKLCDMKFLTSLKDKQLSKEEQKVSAKEAEIVGKTISKYTGTEVNVNTKNHYVLNELSPQAQDEMLGRLVFNKEYGFREKDKCSTSYAMMYGEEESGKILAKGKANISETKLRNFNRAAKLLLEKHRYYNEEMLRKAYLKFDKHTLAKDSHRLVRIYLAKVAFDNNCIKTRVNSDVRDEYELPSKVKSNSFIFVKREEKENK